MGGPVAGQSGAGERRRLAAVLGRRDRSRSQQQRIARQENSNGTAYEPRKAADRLPAKRGRIKRRPMSVQCDVTLLGNGRYRVEDCCGGTISTSIP